MRAGKSWGSRLVGLASIAALNCAMPALADVKSGVDAWSRGDFETAIREWREAAAKGDPDAQFNLAQAYKLGRGVPQDMKKAEQLFAQAAAQGHLEASDNLGLLLFQRGERERAMPLIKAASARGDPRAHYILGLAYFNGDGVAKDWERAYALMSLAQQADLPQAAGALSKMDQFIPLEQRQRSVALASSIAAEADATRARQVTAADLAVAGGSALPPARAVLKPFTPASGATTRTAGPRSAGADYTRGGVPQVASIMNIGGSQAEPAPTSKPGIPAKSATASPAKSTPKAIATSRPSQKSAAPVSPPKSSTPAQGPWRVQLGAFAVAGNADRLWDWVKSRPELAGHAKLKVPAGRVTKLQAGGFADSASAQAACRKLKAAGLECLAVRD